MGEETIGNDFKFQLGNGASPELFEDFCAVIDVGELGEESPLVRLTSLCDDVERYRAGLADGLEIPLQANFAQGDDQIRAMYEAFKGKTELNFRLVTKASPVDSFAFTAIVRGWRISPPVGDRTTVTFTLKIVSEVMWDEAA